MIMTELFVFGSLVALAYYVGKFQNPLLTTAKSNTGDDGIIRNYAYVSKHTGTRIFKTVSNNHIPTYGYGRDEIALIPYRTYLGKATGNFRNGLIEISTTINTKNISFWVNSKDISLLSKEEYDLRKKDEIIEKTDDVIRKLIKL